MIAFITQYGIILVIILIIFSLIFRKQIKGLFEDYVYDAGLSFLDNFIGGAGLIGLDIGDWIAGGIIFYKERHISNYFVAGLVAWEATNFIPFSLIPGIGELLEIIFNFFPAVTISRILFSKYGPASRANKKLQQDIRLAQQLGISHDAYKKHKEKIQEFLDQDNPVEALKEAKKTDKEIVQHLQQYVNTMIQNVQQMIQDITNQSLEVPTQLAQQLQQILQDAVDNSQGFLTQAQQAAQQGNFQTAINATQWARRTIADGANQVNTILQSYS